MRATLQFLNFLSLFSDVNSEKKGVALRVESDFLGFRRQREALGKSHKFFCL